MRTCLLIAIVGMGWGWLDVTSLPAAEKAGTDKPNVLVVLADDQGWGDLSLSGNQNLATPHLDSLARDGARVEHFYVCQVCAPTRAEFLTGRYHPQTGVSGVSRGEERLNPDETTLADLFQRAGYATGAFGKWHNGTQPPYHPNDRGFEEFYGFTSGHWGHYFSPPLDHNGHMVRGNGFVVDDFTDHAIEFIRDNRDRPFFCYLPVNTPHSPMMVPDRFYEKFDGFDPPMRHRDPDKEDLMMTRAALAMVENIDWNVGRVLATLDELGLRDDTIVVYFSDNGPNSFRWNGGMKGRKGSIDEGGLRSPCLIRWPAKIPAGTVVRQLAGAIDLLPTLAELSGIEAKTAKPIDGQSFRPWLVGERVDQQPRHLFSIRNNEVSVRTLDFRLDNSGQLFDLNSDPGQHHDVADRYPFVAVQLREWANQHRDKMAKAFAQNADRPFTVGFRSETTLPARDGVPHGTIQRSAKAPNNSFFEHWTDLGDSITWDVEVLHEGEYEVVVFYTCAEGDQGAVITVSIDEAPSDQVARGGVDEPFDPPLYDKSKERVKDSHYFVKDFRPLSLGTLRLQAGRGVLRLKAESKPGEEVIDVHSIQLVRKADGG